MDIDPMFARGAVPAGVKHWHGAKAGSWFTHLAVEVPGENARVEWLEPVGDEEYQNLGERRAGA